MPGQLGFIADGEALAVRAGLLPFFGLAERGPVEVLSVSTRWIFSSSIL